MGHSFLHGDAGVFYQVCPGAQGALTNVIPSAILEGADGTISSAG